MSTLREQLLLKVFLAVEKNNFPVIYYSLCDSIEVITKVPGLSKDEVCCFAYREGTKIVRAVGRVHLFKEGGSQVYFSFPVDKDSENKCKVFLYEIIESRLK